MHSTSARPSRAWSSPVPGSHLQVGADRLLLLWVAVRTLGRLQRFFVDRQGGEGVVPVLRTGGAPVNEAKVGKRPAGAVGGQAMRLSPSVVLETPCLVSDGDNMLVRFGSHQVHGR